MAAMAVDLDAPQAYLAHLVEGDILKRMPASKRHRGESVIGARAWTACRSASCRRGAARSGSSGLTFGIPVFDSATFDPLCFSKISRGREMASCQVSMAASD
jgi:hypothetical protein